MFLLIVSLLILTKQVLKHLILHQLLWKQRKNTKLGLKNLCMVTDLQNMSKALKSVY